MNCHRGSVVLITALGLAALTACGSSSSGSSSPAAGGAGPSTASASSGKGKGSAPTIHLTFALSGATPLTTSVDVPIPNTDDFDPTPIATTCAGYAKGSQASSGLTLLLPGEGGSNGTAVLPTVDGQNLDLRGDIDSYTGPATYTNTEMTGADGSEVGTDPVHVDLTLGTTDLKPATDAATATITADGGGTITLTSSQPNLDTGTISWTCSG